MHNKIRKDDYAQRYPNRSYKRRTSHKKSVKRVDKKKTYRQKEIEKKRGNRPIHKSSTQIARTHHRSTSRSEVKARTLYRKDTTRPTNRHLKRQEIQQRSLSRERKQY